MRKIEHVSEAEESHGVTATLSESERAKVAYAAETAADTVARILFGAQATVTVEQSSQIYFALCSAAASVAKHLGISRRQFEQSAGHYYDLTAVLVPESQEEAERLNRKQ